MLLYNRRSLVCDFILLFPCVPPFPRRLFSLARSIGSCRSSRRLVSSRRFVAVVRFGLLREPAAAIVFTHRAAPASFFLLLLLPAFLLRAVSGRSGPTIWTVRRPSFGAVFCTVFCTLVCRLFLCGLSHGVVRCTSVCVCRLLLCGLSHGVVCCTSVCRLFSLWQKGIAPSGAIPAPSFSFFFLFL